LKSKFFTGQTGSGKTLGMVKEGVKDFILGRTLFATMKKIQNIPYYYVDLEDLILMVQNEELDVVDDRPKTLMLDEIHTMFDGRRSSSRENIDFSLFVSQCRKRRFNVYYTSQWITGADTRIRTLTNEFVRCFAHHSINDVGLGTLDEPEPIALTQVSSSVLDMQENPYNYRRRKKTFPRWRNRPFYKFYDTYEVIRPVESYAI
jgi:hypothetical protein